MSTLKVNKIEATGTTDGGIEIDSAGHVQLDGVQLPTTGALSNRNLVINGAMQVAQRGTQVTSVTADGYRTCDRFRCVISSLGTWTVDRSTDAPDGFSNSLKLTCTTAEASPTGTDLAIIHQRIEGQNLQHLKFGTANALPLTVSFWVKSNKTGSASFGMYQSDASTRNVNNSYTINSADTWEHKTLTFAGDASGAIDNDNGDGLCIEWWLNSGSGLIGTHQTTWNTYNETSRNSSNLGVGGAVDDYFAITGVQLEVGDKATPFEHRSIGDELAHCRRYYRTAYVLSGGNTQDMQLTAFGSSSWFKHMKMDLSEMRALPTLALVNNSNIQYYSNSSAWATSTVAVTSRGAFPESDVLVYGTGDTGANGKLVRKTTAGNVYVTMDSEL